MVMKKSAEQELGVDHQLGVEAGGIFINAHSGLESGRLKKNFFIAVFTHY
jgi:hypothetical protein